MANRFVDLSAAENGDGTDGNQAGSPGGTGAWNQLTSTELVEVDPGDRVWIRRTDGTGGAKKTLTFKNGGGPWNRIEFNGWPVDADDEHWEDRPAHTAQATWDSDMSEYVVINPFGGAATYSYRTYRRLFWEELGSAANEPFNPLTSSSGELRWYRCQAERATAVAPQVGGGVAGTNGPFGRVELDDVHIIGQSPPAIQFRTAGGAAASTMIRVRITYTESGGNQFMRFANGNTGVLVDIIEFNDVGSRYIDFNNEAWYSGRGRFTTDDQNVGVLSAGGRVNAASTQGQLVLRNLDFGGPNSPPPDTNSTIDINAAQSDVYLENVAFHPSDPSQINLSSNNAHIRGRNIERLRPVMVSAVSANVSAHRSRFINFHEASHVQFPDNHDFWYRLHAGSRMFPSKVFRTGGHGNGIQIEMLKRSASFYDTDLVGRRVGGVHGTELEHETTFVFPVEGLTPPVTHDLEVYFCTAFWEGLESKQTIWVEVDKKTVVDGQVKRQVLDSRFMPEATLEDDGSVWNNIFNHRAMKLTVPVEIETEDDLIAVRFYVGINRRDAGFDQNVLILDPKVTFEEAT